jgi:hypothetical protein
MDDRSTTADTATVLVHDQPVPDEVNKEIA